MAPPIIVNRPVEMLRLNLIVPKHLIETVTRLLQDLGITHIEKAGKGYEEYQQLYERMNNVLAKIKQLINYATGISLNITLTKMEIETLTVEHIEKDINTLYAKVEGLVKKISDLEQESTIYESIKKIMHNIPEYYKVKNICFKGKRLSAITLMGRHDSYEQFTQTIKDIHVIYDKTFDQNVLSIIVFPTQLYNTVIDKLEQLGLDYVSVEKISPLISLDASIGEALKILGEKIEELRNTMSKIKEEIHGIIKEALTDLGKYMLILENKLSSLKAILSTYKSKHLTLITGWVPKENASNILEALNKQGISYYYEFKEPVKGTDEPPTMLKNPPVIKWYEPIVKFLGLPRYWEWDPTPIIAYSFALFYGIMLADMGYAIGIILSAIFILDKFVSDPENRDYVFFKKSLIVSSIMGFIIGSLSGTVFGITIHPIVEMLVNPLQFLVLALIIGLIHVNVAHALTLAKGLKEKSIGDVLIESGLFISEIFGIPYVLYYMLGTPLPWIPSNAYGLLLYGVFVGIGLIVAGSLKNMGFLGLLMWLFNLTGLLGDVLSYSRLAGVGLATVFLGSSFNSIALLAYDGLGSVIPSPLIHIIIGGLVASVILVFGHLLNTALSALGGFIHSIRLCFVEFLSKFYEGTGYPFEPLKIVMRKRIVIE